jgi:hypothetical protein
MQSIYRALRGAEQFQLGTFSLGCSSSLSSIFVALHGRQYRLAAYVMIYLIVVLHHLIRHVYDGSVISRGLPKCAILLHEARGALVH